MYGAQTKALVTVLLCRFENDVEMYGAQTALRRARKEEKFENDVEMYGAQTSLPYFITQSGVRI